MQIQILGLDCPTCRRMEKDVNEIIRQLDLDAQVEHVDDLEKILQFQLTALPGLVIDGRLATCGYHGKRKIENQLTNWGKKL